MSDTNEPDWTKDDYWGKGGSYVVDPATGKRRPRTAADEAPAIKDTPPSAETAAPARRAFGRGTSASTGGDSA